MPEGCCLKSGIFLKYILMAERNIKSSLSYHFCKEYGDFYLFYHDLKACFKKHPMHKEILEKMGFPENWERIGRIKKYIKSEIR